MTRQLARRRLGPRLRGRGAGGRRARRWSTSRRLAEEITWWSNPRFGFVRVADAFSTGSSMMPNKKNPDPAELVRGRAAARHRRADRRCSTLLKGLPLAYQRDLQEDKPRALRRGRHVSRLARGHGRAASRRSPSTADRMREAAEEGYTTATAARRRARPARRPVPRRPPHRRRARRRRRGRGDRRRSRGCPTRRSGPRSTARTTRRARGLAKERGIAAALRAAARSRARSRRADVTGGTAPGPRRRGAGGCEGATPRLNGSGRSPGAGPPPLPLGPLRPASPLRPTRRLSA